LDHCWDCSYFRYLVKNYIVNFPNMNPYNKDVSIFVNKIIEIIARTNMNRLKEQTKIIKKGIYI